MSWWRTSCRPSALRAVVADLPPLGRRGSFPLDALTLGPNAQALMDELEGPRLRQAIAGRFGLDLADAPTMVTLRGWTNDRDGAIHCDSTAKRVTVLLYLNPANRLLGAARGLPASAARSRRSRGLHGGGAAGERHAAGVPERPERLAWPPAVHRPALFGAAQLHDHGCEGTQRAAAASDLGFHEAPDPGGVILRRAS